MKQLGAADHPQRGVGESWSNSLGMEFVWVPAGSFLMGSPREEEGRHSNERPHWVRVSEGFSIKTCAVTQGEWETVMGDNPSCFQKCGPCCPVERVSWDDAQQYIRRLNRRESGRGKRYRLPTEAEWEYAARAGTTGSRYGELIEVAWYWGNSDRRPHRVGTKRANEWGLHDMLGNVWEWTADWYGRYPEGPVTDPRGPAKGASRVARGGSWYIDAQNSRFAYRYGLSPGIRRSTLGFRLVSTD